MSKRLSSTPAFEVIVQAILVPTTVSPTLSRSFSLKEILSTPTSKLQMSTKQIARMSTSLLISSIA